MKKCFPSVVLAAVIAVCCVGQAFAISFQIDKAKVRLKMPAGWSDGGTIVVENKADDPVTIRVYAGDWVYKGQDGSKIFSPSGTNKNSCAEWIKFYPANFTAAPHKTQNVNFTVGIPQGSVGGYYGVLFFEAEVGMMYDEKKGVNVKVFNRLGSLFYIEPDGTIKRDATIANLVVKNENNALSISGDFHNSGNIDITTEGTFDIIDDAGYVTSRGQFNKIYTLPNDKATITATGPLQTALSGTYDLVLTFDLDGGVLVKEWKLVAGADGAVTVQEIVEQPPATNQQATIQPQTQKQEKK